MQIKNIQEVVKSNNCLGCGACYSLPNTKLSSKVDLHTGIKVPIGDLSLYDKSTLEFRVCPGKGYPITKFDILKENPKKTYELGSYHNLYLATSNNLKIRENASSGGVMTNIALFLLDNNLVDGIISNKFIYKNGIRTKTYIAENLEELILGQGSKYCPTETNSVISECLKTGKRYVFIGLPCQIASLRLLQKEKPELNEIFPYTISNFCGGFKDYREIDRLVSKANNVSRNNINKFRFRGGGQPGSLLISDTLNNKYEEPYPEYARGSKIPKMNRCTFCEDATAELADFACGDAWIDRLSKSNKPWSIVITRSISADNLMKQMFKNGLIERGEEITEIDVVKSQQINIDSKKHRQYYRRKLNSLSKLPNFETKLRKTKGNYIDEIKILISKKLVQLGLK